VTICSAPSRFFGIFLLLSRLILSQRLVQKRPVRSPHDLIKPVDQWIGWELPAGRATQGDFDQKVVQLRNFEQGRDFSRDIFRQ
jgi:hypothetical protein